MRVAFVLETPLRYGGGVSMVVRTLIEGLPQSFRFVLVSPDSARCLKKDPLSKRIDQHISWQAGRAPPHPEFYQTTRQVLPNLIATQPNLVHFHSGGVFSWGNRWPGASWPAQLHRHHIPCVWTNHLVVNLFHGYCGDRKPFWFKLAMLPLGYFSKCQQLWATSAEICDSNHDADKMRRWYFPFQKKISRIYISRTQAQEIGFSTLGREKMVLAVGHVAFRKGQHILTQAFARICREHSDWKLVLVGPESLDGCGDWIRNFCQKEGLKSKVILAGPRDDAWDWMKRCAIFVQPSLQEALGLALQEALACGCSCIGTKVGGIPEMIHDRLNGRLVSPGDAGEMANALKELIANPKLRDSFGREGVKQIQILGMSQEAMIDAYHKIYQAALLSP